VLYSAAPHGRMGELAFRGGRHHVWLPFVVHKLHSSQLKGRAPTIVSKKKTMMVMREKKTRESKGVCLGSWGPGPKCIVVLPEHTTTSLSVALALKDIPRVAPQRPAPPYG